MKILFVYPNDYLNIGIPTGLSTLIAVLKKEGHDVSLFDYTFIKTNQLNKERIVETSVYKPTAYTIDDLVRDDPIQTVEEAFEKHLNSYCPDLICLSAMTGLFDVGTDLLNKFKSKLKCKVVAGGVHSTIAPEDALSSEVVDFICIGEGEEFLLEVCECLEKGKDYRHINNLGYKTNKGVQLNESRTLINLDELPIPDWSAFDRRHLFRPFMGEVYQGSFYIMSRGCPFRCAYCVNGPLKEQLKGHGIYYRYQSPKTTIKQISYLKQMFNATWFKFVDDSIMGFKEDYLEELSEGLAPLNIKFGCSVRPETANEKKVSLLKGMGCVSMSIGVESGNEELRKKVLNRKMSNKQIERAIFIIKSHGIRASTFNMIGLPGETRENVYETIKFNKSLGVKAVNIYIVYPYPRTEIYNKYNLDFRDKTGKIIPVNMASSFNLSKMSSGEVEGLRRVFSLYLILPEELWPVIKYAEMTDEIGNVVFDSLTNYSAKMLN